MAYYISDLQLVQTKQNHSSKWLGVWMLRCWCSVGTRWSRVPQAGVLPHPGSFANLFSHPNTLKKLILP